MGSKKAHKAHCLITISVIQMTTIRYGLSAVGAAKKDMINGVTEALVFGQVSVPYTLAMPDWRPRMCCMSLVL
jgi:hypothetical protein